MKLLAEAVGEAGILAQCRAAPPPELFGSSGASAS